jgi:hypothetical protein
VAVNNRTCAGGGIAPERETHMPAIANVQTS